MVCYVEGCGIRQVRLVQIGTSTDVERTDRNQETVVTCVVTQETVVLGTP